MVAHTVVIGREFQILLSSNVNTSKIEHLCNICKIASDMRHCCKMQLKSQSSDWGGLASGKQVKQFLGIRRRLQQLNTMSFTMLNYPSVMTEVIQYQKQIVKIFNLELNMVVISITNIENMQSHTICSSFPAIPKYIVTILTHIV
ncbi:hypothetical protein CEXT_773111 [Caerostris extrusa]|uniref:Uncharacterized protein n=1 Tax=Caerostris extrusa TaxID=172846 RepID=A0AAV4QGB9_CAEEX|nr:hypothetical protein CEXT_773111 [Caerostris extrusa]